MMKKIAFLLPMLGLVLLTACLPPPQRPYERSYLSGYAEYGPPPPDNYKEMIQSNLSPSFVTDVIFGSKSVEYEFYPPVKGWVESSRVLGTKNTFGWVVCGTLTRKERFSGYPRYDGPIRFYALFKNGKIVDRLVGQSTYDHTTQHELNDDIKAVCSREKP
jgi:hypothetical protein